MANHSDEAVYSRHEQLFEELCRKFQISLPSPTDNLSTGAEHIPAYGHAPSASSSNASIKDLNVDTLHDKLDAIFEPLVSRIGPVLLPQINLAMLAAEPYLNEIRNRTDAKINQFDFSTAGVTKTLGRLHRRSITAQKVGIKRWQTTDIRLLQVAGRQLVEHCQVAEEMAKTSSQPRNVLSSANAQKIVDKKVVRVRKREIERLMLATAKILRNMASGTKKGYVNNVTGEVHVNHLVRMVDENIKVIEGLGLEIKKVGPTNFDGRNFKFSIRRRNNIRTKAISRLSAPTPEAI